MVHVYQTGVQPTAVSQSRGRELLAVVVALVEGKPSPRSNAMPSLYGLSRKLKVQLYLPALTKLVKNRNHEEPQASFPHCCALQGGTASTFRGCKCSV